MAKIFEGPVVSLKMNKTVVVEVESKRLHPIYKKTITRTKKYKVHNESPEVKEGDLVSFVETRPLSKEKKYKLVKVLRAK
ncbi:30S ribosomal protein S17 [Candidatus Microgenomates bacterium]|nr:30S ribosomal protein S17 [Candidatus Microgenomates bacterium]